MHRQQMVNVCRVYRRFKGLQQREETTRLYLDAAKQFLVRLRVIVLDGLLNNVFHVAQDVSVGLGLQPDPTCWDQGTRPA